jgi:methionyl-tRNA formyltransferase
MGTPTFAIDSLEACLEHGEVVAVVTQPDKPKGRGQAMTASPVKQRALELGLPVLQPVKIKGTDFAAQLAVLAADVAVVTAYGKILPPDVLAAPRLGCLNVHASLLPRFRGAAPIQWAIASGDAETGVCLMQMDAGMDTGPVLDVARLAITAADTSATLHDRLAALGKEVLRRSLPAFFSGALVARAQPSDGVVMAPMIRKEDGVVDFQRTAVDLERRLRAFTPWPGLTTTVAGQRLKLLAVRVASGQGQPGTVLASSGYLELACAEGSLHCTMLQAEGKNAMPAEVFLRGTPIAVGTRLGHTEVV